MIRFLTFYRNDFWFNGLLHTENNRTVLTEMHTQPQQAARTVSTVYENENKLQLTMITPTKLL